VKPCVCEPSTKAHSRAVTSFVDTSFVDTSRAVTEAAFPPTRTLGDTLAVTTPLKRIRGVVTRRRNCGVALIYRPGAHAERFGSESGASPSEALRMRSDPKTVLLQLQRSPRCCSGPLVLIRRHWFDRGDPANAAGGGNEHQFVLNNRWPTALDVFSVGHFATLLPLNPMRLAMPRLRKRVALLWCGHLDLESRDGQSRNGTSTIEPTSIQSVSYLKVGLRAYRDRAIGIPFLGLAIYVACLIGCSSAPQSKVDTSLGGSNESGSGGTGAAKGGASGSTSHKGGAGGVGGTSSATDFAGPLGQRCDANTICGTGLQCFEAAGTEFGDYGPAGGVCSTKCVADADCAGFADSTVMEPPRCVALVPYLRSSTICMPGCSLGDVAACGGREDVACWFLSTARGRVCVPLCNDDSQCPKGMFCDGQVNLCTPSPTIGTVALGDNCDPSGSDACENGICKDFGTGGVCTAYCRRGTFPQCGSVDGGDATCSWVEAGDELANVADTGMCARTCACDTDCASGTYCLEEAGRAGMAKPGVCTVGRATGIPTCS